MTDRTSKFASAILFAGLSSLPVAAAAEDCLKEPTGTAPEGQHWYYHNDRNTQQRCWYLRDLDDRGARTERVAAPTRKMEVTADQSVSDAYAELPARSRAQMDAATAMPNSQQAAVAPAAPVAAAPSGVRATDVIWPDQTGTQAAASPPNAAPADSATVVADPPADAAQPVTDAASAPAAETPVQASAPVDKNYKNPGSLQKLLLVAGGALALAGLIGSALYRLASLGRRRRSKNRWPKRARRPQPTAARRRPAAGPREPQFAKVSAVNVGALTDIGPDQLGLHGDEIPFAPRQQSQTRQTEAPVERIEVIEEFLARFARQAQHQ